MTSFKKYNLKNFLKIKIKKLVYLKTIMKYKIKDIIIKIDNIVYKDDNPFIFNYYSKILNIKSISILNNILDYGIYEDNFDEVLDNHIDKLTKYSNTIKNIINTNK